jgi:ABC-type multidrug transport system fused ATPase/permease subunit
MMQLPCNQSNNPFAAAYMLRASRALHDSAFFVLMSAQMSFFDVTPNGRLLNRFSGDIDRVDVALVNTLMNCATLMIRVLISVVLIAVIMPWFVIVIFAVAIIYFRLLEYMRRVVSTHLVADWCFKLPTCCWFTFIHSSTHPSIHPCVPDT